VTPTGVAVRLQEVDYVVGRRRVLSGVTVEFAPGTLTAVHGPSGSGKTTVLSLAGGLLAPTSGRVDVGGEPAWSGSGDPPPAVALVLQVYGLVPVLSALENVAVALRARGVGPAAAEERAARELSRLGVGDLGHRQVEELSGGQMQRVACARALAVDAPVLLADEPTSELDEGSRARVVGLLRERAAAGATVVVATHDPAVVAEADVQVAIDEGLLGDASGSPAPTSEGRGGTGGRRPVPGRPAPLDGAPTSPTSPTSPSDDAPHPLGQPSSGFLFDDEPDGR
jgi:putative ABC transport system ATP-binding protein